MGHVLIVDDEVSMREFLVICLRRSGHTVTSAASPALALAELGRSSFDIVVTDLRMPGGMDGLGLLRAIKARPADAGMAPATMRTPDTVRCVATRREPRTCQSP